MEFFYDYCNADNISPLSHLSLPCNYMRKSYVTYVRLILHISRTLRNFNVIHSCTYFFVENQSKNNIGDEYWSK